MNGDTACIGINRARLAEALVGGHFAREDVFSELDLVVEGQHDGAIGADLVLWSETYGVGCILAVELV